MTESEYIQQHETYLSSIVSRFIARYPEQRGKMRDDLMQEARIALLIAYRKQEIRRAWSAGRTFALLMHSTRLRFTPTRFAFHGGNSERTLGGFPAAAAMPLHCGRRISRRMKARRRWNYGRFLQG